MKIVAVTACPTGIAHTYMAAEQLEKTAKKLGHVIKVETQGAMLLTENGLGDGGGPVTNVMIKNITVRNAGTTGGFIQGFSSFASISGVTFDNIYMPEQMVPASNLYQMGMTNIANYSDITILPVQTPEPLLFLAQPTSTTLYYNQTAQFTVSAWGNQPLNYQWQMESNGVYVNLSDNDLISGSQTATLTISNINYAEGTNYDVLIFDAYASTNSASFNLTVLAPLGPPVNAIMSTVEPNVSPAADWNTGSYWNNDLPASNTATEYPGSSFEIVAGGGIRTPYNVATANFPAGTLKVDGNGVWNSPANIGQIMLKNASGGTVNFPNLVMAGGQINNYVDSAGTAVMTGTINIWSNTPVVAGNTCSGGTIQLAGQLNGGGSIEYHTYSSSTFQATWVCDLNVSGNDNTYTGTWNIVTGTLMGSGVNSLGTNNITIGTNGAVQTDYNIYNPGGTLVLNGQFDLTQNDAFKKVVIDGTNLPPGVYTCAQLNQTYPLNFPLTWVAQPGGNFNTASGSITVSPPAQVILASAWNGSNLTLTWLGAGSLLQSTNISGPWTTNQGAASPLAVTPSGPQMFYRISGQ